VSSHYSRADADSSITFNVTPAPYPVGSFGRQTAFWIATAIAGVPLVFVVIGLWMVPAGIYFALKTSRAHRANLARQQARQPVSIKVTADHLAANGRHIPLAEIKNFVVTHEDAGPSEDRVHVVRSDAHGVGLNAGLRLNAEQEYVSYQASVRLISDSRPQLLVGGLTEQTANALIDDLTEAASGKADAA
jgi:hypothetical protein